VPLFESQSNFTVLISAVVQHLILSYLLHALGYNQRLVYMTVEVPQEHKFSTL